MIKKITVNDQTFSSSNVIAPTVMISYASSTVSSLKLWLTWRFLSAGLHGAAQRTQWWVRRQEAHWQLCVSLSGMSCSHVTSQDNMYGLYDCCALFVKCHGVISWFTPSIQDEKWPIRRVRSPSRTRAWPSSSYKPKFGGRFYRPRWDCALWLTATNNFFFYLVTCKVLMITLRFTGADLKAFPLCRCSFPRDDHSFHKPGFGNQKYQHFTTRNYFYRRDHPHKLYHVALREREREVEKERYEQKGSPDGSSSPKQNTCKYSVKTVIPHTPPLHLIFKETLTKLCFMWPKVS